MGQADGRVVSRERRAGERRAGDELVDDGMILEMWDLADEIDADADDNDGEELTQIRPAPTV